GTILVDVVAKCPVTVAPGAVLNYALSLRDALPISATDSGSLASSPVLVTINLSDVNETPTVTANQSFTVAENSASGTVVGTVLGTDPDARQNATLTFAKTGDGTCNSLLDVAAHGHV